MLRYLLDQMYQQKNKDQCCKIVCFDGLFVIGSCKHHFDGIVKETTLLWHLSFLTPCTDFKFHGLSSSSGRNSLYYQFSCFIYIPNVYLTVFNTFRIFCICIQSKELSIETHLQIRTRDGNEHIPGQYTKKATNVLNIHWSTFSLNKKIRWWKCPHDWIIKLR